MESVINCRVEKRSLGKMDTIDAKNVPYMKLLAANVTIEGDKEVVDEVLSGITKFLEISKDLELH